MDGHVPSTGTKSMCALWPVGKNAILIPRNGIAQFQDVSLAYRKGDSQERSTIRIKYLSCSLVREEGEEEEEK